MWRVTHKVTAGLIIALGVLHCAFTFHDYDRVSLDAMWFLGSGIAIILAGFLNVAAIRVGGLDRVVKLLCLTANLIFAALFAAALWLLTQPQVSVGVALFAVAAISLILSERDRHS